MTSARYLVRFDDICPTMQWGVWNPLERMLKAHGVKPLLAVVPDNRDPTLAVADPHPDFWGEVRKWQSWGWTIGLHGYQHTYVTSDSGLLGINSRSEFAGLSLREQQEKIDRAVAIFRANGVEPDLWIAPAHSFDRNTLQALKRAGVITVSDGYFRHPGIDAGGITWVPQQLWEFRPMPRGTWTVCYHCNDWSDERIAHFRANLTRYSELITSVDEVKAAFSGRRQGVMDRGFSLAIRAHRQAREQARRLRRRLVRQRSARRARSVSG